MVFLKHTKLKRILPFLGISLIFFYWLSLFNHTYHIREALTCYNSRGYLAVKDLMTKRDLYSLIHNCSNINFDNSSIFLINQPTIRFSYADKTLPVTSISPSDFDSFFEGNIHRFDTVITSVALQYNAPNFAALFSRNVSFERNGLTFSVKQKIELEKIEARFNIFVSIIVPIVALIFLFSRPVNLTIIVPISLSTLAIFMHTFFYGKYLPLFRLILSIAWICEFGLMVGLQIKGYTVVLPIIILTMSVACAMYSYLFKSSRWFKDIQTGYLATISLMVGDHIMEMMTSIEDFSFPFYFKYGLTSILVLILVFVILSSVGAPFKRLTHVEEVYPE